MSRTSDKHSPRQDDQLEHDEQALLHGHPDESRTEPRRAEAPGPDEPGIGTRSGSEEPVRGAPGPTEIEDRAALAATFPPKMFPAHRDELIETARDRFADELLSADLVQIPDRLYHTFGEVWVEVHVVRLLRRREQ